MPHQHMHVTYTSLLNMYNARSIQTHIPASTSCMETTRKRAVWSWKLKAAKRLERSSCSTLASEEGKSLGRTPAQWLWLCLLLHSLGISCCLTTGDFPSTIGGYSAGAGEEQPGCCFRGANIHACLWLLHFLVVSSEAHSSPSSGPYWPHLPMVVTVSFVSYSGFFFFSPAS